MAKSHVSFQSIGVLSYIKHLRKSLLQWLHKTEMLLLVAPSLLKEMFKESFEL